MNIVKKYQHHFLILISIIGISILIPTLLRKTYRVEFIASIPKVNQLQEADMSKILRSLTESGPILQSDIETYAQYLDNNPEVINPIHNTIVNFNSFVKLTFIVDNTDLNIILPLMNKIIEKAFQEASQANFSSKANKAKDQRYLETLIMKRNLYNSQLLLLEKGASLNSETLSQIDLSFLTGLSLPQRILLLKADVSVMNAQIEMLKQSESKNEKIIPIEIIKDSITTKQSGPYYKEFFIYSFLIILCNLIFILDRKYLSNIK